MSLQGGGSGDGVLIVPTSVIAYQGRTPTVQIAIGPSGPLFTQVASGLKAGQQVVVADLNAPLPTITSVRGLGGGIVAGR